MDSSIAVRKLIIRNNDGEVSGEVELRILMPIEAGDDFSCRYEIHWQGRVKISDVLGVDAVQALLLALQRLASEMYFSDEYKTGRLEWMGGNNLGLPLPAGLEPPNFSSTNSLNVMKS